MNHYLWVLVEKFGNIGLRIVSIMLLARILTPEDFGLFAMVAIFIVISSALIDSGLGLALIKKQNASDVDYSTALIFNVFAGCTIYAIIYLIAPYVAMYYKAPKVESLLQLLSLVIVVRPMAIIQITRLSKELSFKPQAVIYFSSSLISLLVALLLALNGWGVWSLIWQQIVEAILTTSLFYGYSRYFPKLVFSKKSFRELFGFGFLVMLSSMVRSLYLNLLAVIFGRQFNAVTVGFYAQAYKLNEIYINTASSVIDKVSFPILVKNISDKCYYEKSIKNLMRGAVFICFGLTAVIASCANLIVTVLLGDGWEQTIWMLEIVSISGFGLIVEAVSRSIVKSKASARLIFGLEVFKCGLSLSILLLAIPMGVRGMLWAFVAVAGINALISMLAVSKIAEYRLREQFRDIYSQLVLAVALFALLSVVNDRVDLFPHLKLIALTVLGAACYFLAALMLKVREAEMVSKLLKEKFATWLNSKA